MTARRALKRLVESLFHVTIYSAAPHGRDDCRDLQRSGAPIRTILDVGANDGGSARKFIGAFPEATIHCFEPVRATYEELRRTVQAHPSIHCHQLALGAEEGEATIYLTPHSSTSSLVRPDNARGEERVRVTTVDRFVAEQGLGRIDLLKVDAEGFDLEVLKGAEETLTRGGVGFVLAEVAFHRDSARHVLFDEVRDFLVPKGFAVFGIYDQQPEWSGEKKLRYANVCFIGHRRSP